MKLDFNETNILIQVIDDLEKRNKSINKSSIVNLLYELMQNTEKQYVFVRYSIKTLASKIELLSENSIAQICTDKKNNNIIATVCYILPTSN